MEVWAHWSQVSQKVVISCWEEIATWERGCCEGQSWGTGGDLTKGRGLLGSCELWTGKSIRLYEHVRVHTHTHECGCDCYDILVCFKVYFHFVDSLDGHADLIFRHLNYFGVLLNTTCWLC